MMRAAAMVALVLLVGCGTDQTEQLEITGEGYEATDALRDACPGLSDEQIQIVLEEIHGRGRIGGEPTREHNVRFLPPAFEAAEEKTVAVFRRLDRTGQHRRTTFRVRRSLRT